VKPHSNNFDETGHFDKEGWGKFIELINSITSLVSGAKFLETITNFEF